MTSDKPGLIAYRVAASGMKLAAASSEREWMSHTEDGFAKRCLPLLIANQAGWLVLNDRPVRALWRGGMARHDVVVENGRDPPHSATSHFGHGILTFSIPFLFCTTPPTALLFRGPANSPKDGIFALEGMVETDWSVATATMNWKFTRPGVWIEFAQDEPICMVVPQRLDALEVVRPEIRDLKQDPSLAAGYRAWRRSRKTFLKKLSMHEPSTVERAWERHYFKGTQPDGDGRRSVADFQHRTRLKLAEFIETTPAAPARAADDSPLVTTTEEQ